MVLDHFGSFQMALISWNTKYAQRYLSFIFTLFTIPGDNSKNFYRIDFDFLFENLEPTATRLPVHDFAHDTLNQLVRIVPLCVDVFSFSSRWTFLSFRASTLLCPIAEQQFPYMTKEIQIQITYIKNLLRSSSYLSHQRLKFLEIIISKLLRLDVTKKLELSHLD